MAKSGRTVFLISFPDSIEANIVKGRLESEGISCYLANENFGTLMHLNYIAGMGINLFVDERDVERAMLILDENDQARVTERVICPDCGSINVHFGKKKNPFIKLIIVILSQIFCIPAGNMFKVRYCKDCGTKF